MIARLWRGQTSADKADAYEELLRSEILPGIHGIRGYRGAYLMRRDVEAGVEFVTLTLWESMDAVQEFAGKEYETAVVPPEARELLSSYDRTSAHYETILTPD
ncbi:MAG: antibiotic biosynthesis monooxygenase [Anaerolineae bacterium]|nr:antibiotic biosynthesis monooxygenase [Anaerolineae bacterium]